MSSKSKLKGDRVERKILKLLQDLGLKASRTLLSAQSSGKVDEDVNFDVPLVGSLKGEVKTRAAMKGYKVIADWLSEVDALFLDVPRGDPMVVLHWSVFKDLISSLRGAYSASAYGGKDVDRVNAELDAYREPEPYDTISDERVSWLDEYENANGD